jgi:hypothetical protein
MSAVNARVGALAGLLGGVVMAMWSMVAFAATGAGFWTPVNLIAHTIWRGHQSMAAPASAPRCWA